MPISLRGSIVAAVAAAFVGGLGFAAARLQRPSIRNVEEHVLREYAGVYRWAPDAFVYLQMWTELGNQLVAFDESGELRTLYPTGPAGRDEFFVGPGAAVSSSVEARVAFRRDEANRIVSLTWTADGRPVRTAERVDIERHEPVRFDGTAGTLAGTLIRPTTGGPHPAIILVHWSGAANREGALPFVRFLVRHGIAVLGYDKRGVGESGGN